MNTLAKDRTRQVTAGQVAEWNIPFELVLKDGSVSEATATPTAVGTVLVSVNGHTFPVSADHRMTLRVAAYDTPSLGHAQSDNAADDFRTQMEAEKDAYIHSMADRFSGRTQPATERQLAYLNRLLDERPAMRDVENLHPDVVARLSKKDASMWIEQALATPRETEATAAPAQRPLRTNKYAGKCDDCGARVEAEEGTVHKADDGKWVVNHIQCPATDFPFPLGRYAVDGEDGATKFYQATQNGLFVQASDELHPVHASAQDAIIAKIAADPRAASIRYGQELGECGRCGRTLTDETSRAAGIGPVCATKGW